ncbi:chorismate mutase [Roseicyclus sp. F158]|uniref:chorismate mutase n=1 Tax=Tropicimonas omnivorans TaxID=3075590 RepID=A0ABU3DG09_9RHOB|nr:chorismate mutase [Roseicyclus sp. F158]MDT0682657.1 chorismate mutase [Roseicyclus sp. F158]
MGALRLQIDEIDRELIALLVERAAHIDRAAELKPAAGLPAHIDSRVEEVVNNVRAAANGAGLDADLAEDVWRRLIGWSIAREEMAMQHSGIKGADE